MPSPPSGHWSAAANARAATDRPEPGGPVNSQACVIAAGIVDRRRAVRRRRAAWPTTCAQTPSSTAAVTGAAAGSSRSGRADGAGCPARRDAVHGGAAVGGRDRLRDLLQRQAGEQLGHPHPDRRGDLVGGLPGVDDEVAVGVGLGERAERLPHPLVEVQRLRLEPVGDGPSAGPRQPHLGRQVEQHGEVGLAGPRSPSATACGRRPAGSCGRRPGRPASCRRTGR